MPKQTKMAVLGKNIKWDKEKHLILFKKQSTNQIK